MIGAYFFSAPDHGVYAYNFSAPAILQGVTGWSVTNAGFLVACIGLVGAAGMLINSASSDRKGERALHCIVPCVVMAAGYLTASWRGPTPWLSGCCAGGKFHRVHGDAGAGQCGSYAVFGGRAAAAGIAAMNSITMFSGFVGLY